MNVSVLFYILFYVAWMVSHFVASSDENSERSTCELSTLVFLTVSTLHVQTNKTRNKKPCPSRRSSSDPLPRQPGCYENLAHLNNSSFQLHHQTSVPRHKNNTTCYCYLTGGGVTLPV